MRLLLFVIFICWGKTFASELELDLKFKSLSCSQHGTRIIFVNGVWNTAYDSKKSTEVIEQLVRRNEERFDSKGAVEFRNIWNPSESWDIDLIQVAVQVFGAAGLKVEESVNEYKYDKKVWCLDHVDECKEVDSRAARLLISPKYNSEKTRFDLVDKITGAFLVGKKVILVSHSQGNLYANEVYEKIRKSSPEESMKYYGNLQVAPATHSVSSKNGKHILLAQDFVIGALSLIPFLTQSANYVALGIPNGVPDFHRFLDYYLNPSINLVGKKQGDLIPSIRTAENVFLDSLEELAWTLANNDENCCNGEDGRFYRADYDSEPQGFVGNKVSVDKKVNLVVSNDSQICGDVSISANSSENTVVLDNASKINGEFPISISGFVYLTDSEITNPDDSLTLSLLNSSKELPLYFNSSRVEGATTFNGPIFFNNTIVEGVNILEGSHYKPIGEEFYYGPSFDNATVSTGTVTNGFYYIARDIAGSTVEGKTKEVPGDTWRSTFANPHSVGLENAWIKDHVAISGRVDPSNYFFGSIVGSNYNGVIIGPGSRVYSGSSVLGSTVFEVAEFQGYWEGHLNPTNGSSVLKFGKVMNPPIAYNPNPYYSKVVYGAPYINGAEIYNTDISGYPTVAGGTYNSCTMACNANIIGETATGKVYSCDYSTGSKMSDDDLVEAVAQSDDEFEKLRQSNKEHILSVKSRIEKLTSDI